jgi:TonB family protein
MALRSCPRMGILKRLFIQENSFLKIWLFSMLFHLLLLAIFFYSGNKSESLFPVHLTEGASFTIRSKSKPFEIGKGNEAVDSRNVNAISGTKTEDQEVESFRNSLSYPELAIEQGLEDDCIFRVTVAENGVVEKLVVVAPCKFNVFDSQIRSQLRFWKFESSKGKDLVLPIRFRIHVRN